MPNVENLRLVAADIRSHEDQFSLSDWSRYKIDPVIWDIDLDSPLNSCNTICCISGWTNARAGTLKESGKIDYSNTDAAATYFGLSEKFTEDLCIPNDIPNTKYPEPWDQAARLGIVPSDRSVYGCTAEQAAQVLEAIADGKIKTY